MDPFEINEGVTRDSVRLMAEEYLRMIAEVRGVIKDIEVKVTGNPETGCLCVDLISLTPEGDEMLMRAVAEGMPSSSCSEQEV